jgi:hypothetical protein
MGAVHPGPQGLSGRQAKCRGGRVTRIATLAPDDVPACRPRLPTMSGCSQVSYTGRIQRRAGRIRCTPDHPGAAPGIQDGLLTDLVSSRISKGSGKDEDDLVLGVAPTLEDVLQDPGELDRGERLANLLAEFAVDCVQGVLAELDMTAERAVKHLPRRVRFLRHQQRAIAWPPNQHHRLDDLAPGFHRYVVSRLAKAAGKAGPDRRTVSLSGNGSVSLPVAHANCTEDQQLPRNDQSPGPESGPDLGLHMERVTGIEPALSAWEADVLPLNYTRAARAVPPAARPDIVPEPARSRVHQPSPAAQTRAASS